MTKLVYNKIESVEKLFTRLGVDFDLHLSGISNSAYFTFDDKNDNSIILRLSDHDLPAIYQTRANRYVDFRFTDSQTTIRKFIEKMTGKTKVVSKKSVRSFTENELELLKKEVGFFGFDLTLRIYNLVRYKRQLAKALL